MSDDKLPEQATGARELGRLLTALDTWLVVVQRKSQRADIGDRLISKDERENFFSLGLVPAWRKARQVFMAGKTGISEGANQLVLATLNKIMAAGSAGEGFGGVLPSMRRVNAPPEYEVYVIREHSLLILRECRSELSTILGQWPKSDKTPKVSAAESKDERGTGLAQGATELDRALSSANVETRSSSPRILGDALDWLATPEGFRFLVGIPRRWASTKDLKPYLGVPVQKNHHSLWFRIGQLLNAVRQAILASGDKDAKAWLDKAQLEQRPIDSDALKRLRRPIGRPD